MEPALHLSLTNVIVIALAIGNLIWILISAKQASASKGVLLTLETQLSEVRLRQEHQTSMLLQELGRLQLDHAKARREDESRMREWINGSFLRAEEVRTELRTLHDKVKSVTGMLERIEEEGCRRYVQHSK